MNLEMAGLEGDSGRRVVVVVVVVTLGSGVEGIQSRFHSSRAHMRRRCWFFFLQDFRLF